MNEKKWEEMNTIQITLVNRSEYPTTGWAPQGIQEFVV